MAVPKRKVSKTRRDSRRAHNWRIEAPNLSSCPNCKAPTLPHHACPTCGQYQGRQVINVEPKAAAK